MQFLSRSLQLLNMNIRKSTKPSDNTIATVVYLSLSERMRGQYEQGQIHILALKRMVTLRGGIEQLVTNRHLANKIFMYVL